MLRKNTTAVRHDGPRCFHESAADNTWPRRPLRLLQAFDVFRMDGAVGSTWAMERSEVGLTATLAPDSQVASTVPEQLVLFSVSEKTHPALMDSCTSVVLGLRSL